MKAKFNIIVFGFCFLASAVYPADIKIIRKESRRAPAGNFYEYELEVEYTPSDLPNFRFVLNRDQGIIRVYENNYPRTKAEFAQATDRGLGDVGEKLTQALVYNISDKLSKHTLGVEDINFDGYLDLKLRSSCAPVGDQGCFYTYWLYDPSLKEFRNKSADIKEPEVDQKTKTVKARTSWSRFCLGCYSSEEYKWNGYDLVLDREVYHGVDPKSGSANHKLTVLRKIDGKVEVIECRDLKGSE